MLNATFSRVTMSVFMALTFVSMTAEAAIRSVTVNTSRDYEAARGYTYAEITIHGAVVRVDGSLGLYSVPAVIIYPQRGRGNGVGVVDWLNSAFYHFFAPTTEFGTFQFTLLATGNYLFEAGSDGPARATRVLSSGYSQGAAAQPEVITENLDPSRVYDGHLIQMMELACFKRDDVAPHLASVARAGRFHRWPFRRRPSATSRRVGTSRPGGWRAARSLFTVQFSGPRRSTHSCSSVGHSPGSRTTSFSIGTRRDIST